MPDCISSELQYHPLGLVAQKHPLRTRFRRCMQTPVQQNFIFARCFLRSHFPLAPPKILRSSRWNGCSYEKNKADWFAACLDQVSCFCLVRAIKPNINQLRWPLLTTRLGSLSAWHSRAPTMGSFLESSGSRAQLCHKQHFGVFERNFSLSIIGVQGCAGLFLVVLGRLAPGCTKLANLLPEGSQQHLLSLLAFLP